MSTQEAKILAGNEVVSDDLVLVRTEHASIVNIMDGESKVIGNEKREGVNIVVDVKNGISVGITCKGADEVLCQNDGNEAKVIVKLGTKSVNKESTFEDGDGKSVSDSKEARVTEGLYVSDNLEKFNRKGISVVVDFSQYEIKTKCGDVESGKSEGLVDQVDGYVVGDIVWSKFNCHPWWPAQIFDPKDASDKARKRRPVGKYFLVAYFGDGSFLWRLPSQIKPFAENFDNFINKSDDVTFSTAVKEALDEIGRLAELKLACNCISDADKTELIREEIVNPGIRRGLISTECHFNRLPVSEFEPSELLSKMKSVATGDYGINMLDLRGIRSCVYAYYRAIAQQKSMMEVNESSRKRKRSRYLSPPYA